MERCQRFIFLGVWILAAYSAASRNCRLSRLQKRFRISTRIIGLRVSPSSVRGSVALGLGPLESCVVPLNCSLAHGPAAYNASGYLARAEEAPWDRELPLHELRHDFQLSSLEPRMNLYILVACDVAGIASGQILRLETYETATTATPLPAPKNLQAFLGHQIYFARYPEPVLTLEWSLIEEWPSRPIFYEAKCLGLASTAACPQCLSDFTACQLSCPAVVGSSNSSFVDHFVPMLHQTNFGLDGLAVRGATELICAVKGVSMADAAGSWSVPARLSMSARTPAPRVGLMLLDKGTGLVFSATLDPSLPLQGRDGLYTATTIQSAQGVYRPLEANDTAVKPLRHPVRFDFRCCDDNSLNSPLLYALESFSPEISAAFPPGQFRRLVPDNLVRDFCFDYIGHFHFETRQCESDSPRASCVYKIDELVRPSLTSSERAREIYKTSDPRTSVDQIICIPQANFLAWTEITSDGRIRIVFSDSAGHFKGDLLDHCGCGSVHIGSTSISTDFAAAEAAELDGALIFLDNEARIWSISGVQENCSCEQLDIKLPIPAAKVLRLSTDWIYFYWLANMTSAGSIRYKTEIQFRRREGDPEVHRANSILINSRMEEEQLDVMAFNPEPHAGYLDLQAGKKLQYRRISLDRTFDMKAMAPEMRSIGKAKVPRFPKLRVWMTSASTAMSNFSFTWDGNSQSAVAVVYTLYEMKDEYEYCLHETECRLPPYIRQLNTDFRGNFNLLPLESLEPGKRYLLEARARQLIRLLGANAGFPFANATFVADFRDPMPATLSAIIIPLLLLLAIMGAALCWKCRTPWRLRNVPRIAKHELKWDEADKLGSGHFADVFKGKNSGQVVALKVQKATAKSGEKLHFLQEAIIMSGLNHTNVTRILGISIDANPYIIVLEFINGSSLSGYLSAHKQQINFAIMLKICTDCARACKYIASKCYIHRDISAKNFLVETERGRFKRAKITDFGLAVDVGEALQPYTTDMPEFPIRHAAPECFRGTFSVASDVYSLGVVLWEVASLGRLPWAEFTEPKELEYWRRLRRLVSLPQPRGCPDSLYQLMRSCWEVESAQRPTMGEVVKALETLGSLGIPDPSPEQMALLPSDALTPFDDAQTNSSDSGRGTESLEMDAYPSAIVDAYRLPLTAPKETPAPPNNHADDYATNISLA